MHLDLSDVGDNGLLRIQGAAAQAGISASLLEQGIRACGLLDIARSTLNYEPRLPAKDRPVIDEPSRFRHKGESGMPFLEDEGRFSYGRPSASCLGQPGQMVQTVQREQRLSTRSDISLRFRRKPDLQ